MMEEFTVSFITDTVIKFLFNFLGGPFAFSDVARVLLIIAVFSYASYRDIQSRIIPDEVWIPLYIGGLLLFIYDLLNGVWYAIAPSALINISVACIVSILLYKYRVFFGADMKAIIGLGIAFPTYPLLGDYPLVTPETIDGQFIVNNVLNSGQIEITGVFVLAIVVNSAVFGAIYPIKSFVKNIKNGAYRNANPLWLFVAEKKSVDSLTRDIADGNQTSSDEHGNLVDTWSRDFSDNKIKRGFQLLSAGINGTPMSFLSDYSSWRVKQEAYETENRAEEESRPEENTEAESNETRVSVNKFTDVANENADPLLRQFSESNETWEIPEPEQEEENLRKLASKDFVWITPGIPYIVPIFLGTLSAVSVGNLVYYVILHT